MTDEYLLVMERLGEFARASARLLDKLESYGPGHYCLACDGRWSHGEEDDGRHHKGCPVVELRRLLDRPMVYWENWHREGFSYEGSDPDLVREP